MPNRVGDGPSRSGRTDRMLTELDDLLTHQTFETHDRVFLDDPRWTERFIFEVHDRKGEVFLFTGLGIYPNTGYMDGFSICWHDGRQRNLRAGRELGDDRWTLHAGPLRFDIVEPMKTWRLAADDAGSGFSYEIEFRRRCRAFQMPTMHLERDGELLVGYSHFDQGGEYSRLDRGRRHPHRGRRLDGRARPLVGRPARLRQDAARAPHLAPDPVRRPRDLALDARRPAREAGRALGRRPAGGRGEPGAGRRDHLVPTRARDRARRRPQRPHRRAARARHRGGARARAHGRAARPADLAPRRRLRRRARAGDAEGAALRRRRGLGLPRARQLRDGSRTRSSSARARSAGATRSATAATSSASASTRRSASGRSTSGRAALRAAHLGGEFQVRRPRRSAAAAPRASPT